MSKIHNYKGVDYSPKNVNNELIELTDAECEVLLQQTIAWNNSSVERNNATAVFNRQKEYGTVAKQIEFITEKGLEAWKTNVQAIKTKYPKE